MRSLFTLSLFRGVLLGLLSVALLGILLGTSWLSAGALVLLVLATFVIPRENCPKPIILHHLLEDENQRLALKVHRLNEQLAMLRLLESAVVHARDAVIVLEAEPNLGVGRSVLYANQAFAEMTGYSVPEVLGRSLHFLRGPESDERTLEELRVALETNVVFKGELLNYRKDGSSYWAELIVVPVLDLEGVPEHWVMIQRDISDRKRDEEELRRTDRLMRTIINAFPGKLNAKDRDGRYILLNRAQANYYQTTPEQAVGRTVEDLADPSLATRIRHRDVHVIATRDHFQFEERLLCPDGQFRDWLATKVPLVDGLTASGEEVVGILTVYVDVTELKQVQETLRKSERMLADAQRIAHIASWEYDPATQHIEWTDEKFRILGYEPGAFMPSIQKFQEALHPEDVALFVKAISESPVGSTSGEIEFRIIRPNGEVRYLRDEFCPIFHPDGTLHRITGVTHDVTERREAEQRFFQSQKMELVGQMAGGIAHDFNNLLTAIIGNLNLTTTAPGSAQSKQIETALRAAHRAADLTKKLLGFARKNQLSISPLAVKDLVLECFEFISRTFDPSIQVITDVRSESQVSVDPTLMSQVLLNLCVNARDAMPDGGRLTILAEDVNFPQSPDHPDGRAGDFIHIVVEDTGTGIPENLKARIFEPFFTTKPVGKGTGLGLPMVQGTMAQHKGWIECESQVGVGTKFHLYLPKLAAETVPPSSNSLGWQATERIDIATPMPPKAAKVLLVDDEEMIRTIGRAVLESAGMEVLEASDGDEAVELFAKHGKLIDLVVLDLTMPRVPGREACQAIRGLEPTARVLFSSGYSAVDVCASDGALGMLAKPYRPQELLEAVTKALATEMKPRRSRGRKTDPVGTN